jgi:hypothetical protein
MKIRIVIFAIIICISQSLIPAAYAQNLIIEVPYSEGGGTRLERQETEFIRSYYAYTNDFADINISASIFRSLQLTEADVGKKFIIYSFDNYPGFVTFVDNLTNGTNNRFQKAYTFCDGGGGATVGNESNFFGGLTQNGIDFEGYQINSISLTINSLSIDFDGADWYDFSINSTFSFDVTLIDENLDGVPDKQEVIAYSDLDEDGVDDTAQSDMRCLYTPDGECEICVKFPAEVSSFGLIRTIEPETLVSDYDKFDDFPFGLLSFRLQVPVGATVTLTIYYSQEIPSGSVWYKYDPKVEWTDCSDIAVFSEDRNSVRLTLTDGGAGDLDGRTNSIIIDPSGPLIENNSNKNESDIDGSFGSSSGCFISAVLLNGSIIQ